jgi:hypothetical protein
MRRVVLSGLLGVLGIAGALAQEDGNVTLTSFSPARAALSTATTMGAPSAGLELAGAYLNAHRTSFARQDVIALVDYSKPSGTPRLFILELSSGRVHRYLVSHGRGSDADHDGMLDSFSDLPGSNASTKGAFRVAERYEGQHGLSIRLDGLEAGNANARERAVVIHSAPYVDAEMARREGRVGRSFGCFVVEPSKIDEVVSLLAGGTLLYVVK